MVSSLPTARTLRDSTRASDFLADACVPYHSGPNQFERFRGFLELISRFEFDFLRENYCLNDSNFWCVRSSTTHSGRSCACAVACLCPHNSIPNVVVSVTTCLKKKKRKYIFVHTNIDAWRIDQPNNLAAWRMIGGIGNMLFSIYSHT